MNVQIVCRTAVCTRLVPWRKGVTADMRGSPWPGSMGSDAYRVFTTKRFFLVKSSVKILQTGRDGAGNGDFAQNNLRSGRARRPVCQLAGPALERSSCAQLWRVAKE